MTTIRRMKRQEVELAVAWAAREGWNPGLHDRDAFYATDPKGWFLAEQDGETVGVISAVAYGETFGFIGFFIVRPEHRGGRIGPLLAQAARKHLEGRIVGLDGVEAKIGNYQAFGFQMAYHNARHGGIGFRCPKSRAIRSLDKVPFETLLAYDADHFPTERRAFLERWIALPDSAGLAVMKRNRLAGYGMIRRSQTGSRIGPLFADDADVADLLFRNLVTTLPEGEEFFLDIPTVNPDACALVERYGMPCVFRTARMYAGGIPALPMQTIFGVTSFELG